MHTANSGADSPALSLDLPEGQYLLARGCARLVIGCAAQRALSFPVGE